MGYLIFFILLSVLVGAVANKSGRSLWLWFFISVIISPIFSIILLLILWLLNGGVKKSEPEQIFKNYSQAYDFITDNYDLTFTDSCDAAKYLYKNAKWEKSDIPAIMKRYFNNEG